MKRRKKRLTNEQKAAAASRAELFKNARENNRITISQASVDTETTRDTVRAIESAGHDPRESTLIHFANYYASKDRRIKHLYEPLARVGDGNLRDRQGRG